MQLARLPRHVVGVTRNDVLANPFRHCEGVERLRQSNPIKQMPKKSPSGKEGETKGHVPQNKTTKLRKLLPQRFRSFYQPDKFTAVSFCIIAPCILCQLKYRINTRISFEFRIAQVHTELSYGSREPEIV